MSYDNHDQDDPNKVRYAKAKVKTEDNPNTGKAIKIYAMAKNMSLIDFIKWFNEEHVT